MRDPGKTRRHAASIVASLAANESVTILGPDRASVIRTIEAVDEDLKNRGEPFTFEITIFRAPNRTAKVWVDETREREERPPAPVRCRWCGSADEHDHGVCWWSHEENTDGE